MTQRELVLSKIGNRAVTSIILSSETGLSISHCSSYLSELERRGKLKSLGEMFDRTKVYVLIGNRKHRALKKVLVTKEDREWLRKAHLEMGRVKKHLKKPGVWQSQLGESQPDTTSQTS